MDLMKVFQIFRTVFIIFAVFLYVRFFFKRLRLLLSLKKAAKRAGVKLTLATPTFWLPTNRAKRCELFVDAGDCAYGIKVIGLFQKYCDLHFWNCHEYGTRKYLFRWQIDQASLLGLKDTRHKRLNIDFRAGQPDSVLGKRIIPFYLLSPTNYPIHITQNEGNKIVDLEPGSKIDDVIFADREYVFQYIALKLHERTTTKQ